MDAELQVRRKKSAEERIKERLNVYKSLSSKKDTIYPHWYNPFSYPYYFRKVWLAQEKREIADDIEKAIIHYLVLQKDPTNRAESEREIPYHESFWLNKIKAEIENGSAREQTANSQAWMPWNWGRAGDLDAALKDCISIIKEDLLPYEKQIIQGIGKPSL